jgi:hypothetical protein
MDESVTPLPDEAAGRAHTNGVTDWQSLAEWATAAPLLSGAACKGRPELFDWHPLTDSHRGADIETALALRASCPVLSECRQWVASLEWWQRPTGVVAGVLVTPKRGSVPTGQPRGRPPRRRRLVSA